MIEFTQADYLILMKSLRFDLINRTYLCGDDEGKMWSDRIGKVDNLFFRVQSNYRELREVSIRNTDALKIEESDNIPCDDSPGHEPKGSFGI